MHIDPTLFDPDAVSEETRRINAAIVEKLTSLPDQWSFPPSVIRDRRVKGLGPFPLAPKSDHARVQTIDGPRGPLDLRIIAPQTRESRGVYLHVHGGGWTLGAADEQDPRLERIAENCGLTTVSVEYALAPEDPYPAGPDDCECAALWLLNGGLKELGGGVMTVGGESAGANLSAVTMIRLRDRHGITPFCAANLVAGSFDLRMTASTRNWGTEKLILNTRDVEMFAKSYLGDIAKADDPDVSPVLAPVTGFCPALFTIGTRDLLLDDSLMMAQRWLAAGNPTELAVYPGGAHVFIGFAGKLAASANDRIEAFLNEAAGAGEMVG